MEQIQADKQLFISDACYGPEFSQDLITNLFESNPYIAESISRNRIIISTTDMSYEGVSCGDYYIDMGFLTYLICKGNNLLDVFHSRNTYEFSLVEKEVECHFFDGRYFDIYEESFYNKLLIKNSSFNNSRGVGSQIDEKIDNVDPNHVAKLYGMIIGTNLYNPKSNWSNLKNPINDAEVIADVLELQYNAIIHEVYNKPRDTILKEILNIKKIIK